MNDKYIGVFDSGIGGLTVVKALIKALPYQNIIYFGDTKNMPYGNKTNEEIINCVKNAVSFLNKFELKAIVIACNTADSVASNTIRNIYKLPIYGVIEPTCKVALNTTKNNKIGVIATNACIESNEYEITLHKYNNSVNVYSKACPLLAQFIEEGNFDIGNDQMRSMIKDYVDPLIKKDIDTLILGCTHYDLIMDICRDMYPNIQILSSSQCVIEDVKKEIINNENKKADRQYYVSADSNKFKQIVSSFMGDIEVKEANNN